MLDISQWEMYTVLVIGLVVIGVEMLIFAKKKVNKDYYKREDNAYGIKGKQLKGNGRKIRLYKAVCKPSYNEVGDHYEEDKEAKSPVVLKKTYKQRELSNMRKVL